MPKVTQLMATTLQDVKLQQDLLLCPLGARPCSRGMSLNPSSGTVLLPAQVQGGDVTCPRGNTCLRADSADRVVNGLCAACRGSRGATVRGVTELAAASGPVSADVC